jgi:outer membrane protein
MCWTRIACVSLLICGLAWAAPLEEAAGTVALSATHWEGSNKSQTPRKLTALDELQHVLDALREPKDTQPARLQVAQGTTERVDVQSTTDAGADLVAAPSQSTAIEIDRIDFSFADDIGAEEIRRAPLSLLQCVHRALLANQDILITGLETPKSDADILTAQGEFDPLFNSDITIVRSEQSSSSDIFAFGGRSTIEDERTISQQSLMGRLPWGMTYGAIFNIQKDSNTFNNFVPEWSGGLTLTATQPLLRGAGHSYNMTRIKVARNNLERADWQIQLTVMDTVAAVIRAYWDLVGAIEQVGVQEEALETANRLLHINERRLDIGTAAKLDVLQAQAGVASRLGDVIRTKSIRRDREYELLQLLDYRPENHDAYQGVVPTARPQLTELAVDEAASLALALENRPEVHMSEIDIINAQLDQKMASRDMLPQLDLTGTVFQGERGDEKSDVVSGIESRMDNSWSVRVVGSVPLGNRAARGAHQRAKYTRRQAEHTLARTREQLKLAVRIAANSVRTTQVLVQSTRQERRLQEANLQAEERRLRLGVTTSFQLLQVQEDLTLAQMEEVRSLVNFEKALLELRLAEGALLEQLGVDYVPRETESPVTFVRSVLPFDRPE